MKTDLRKAFDSLWRGASWIYVCRHGAFSSFFRDLVLSCVNTVQYDLFLMGVSVVILTLNVGCSRATLCRPFLFIIPAKVLTKMMTVEENTGRLHGIKIGRATPAISHSLYVDDLLISCRANVEEASTFFSNCLTGLVDGLV